MLLELITVVMLLSGAAIVLWAAVWVSFRTIALVFQWRKETKTPKATKTQHSHRGLAYELHQVRLRLADPVKEMNAFKAIELDKPSTDHREVA